MFSRGQGGSQAGRDIDPKRQRTETVNSPRTTLSLLLYRKLGGDETGMSPAGAWNNKFHAFH
jgi:hypothetical protein